LLARNTHSATTGAAHGPLAGLCAPALKPPVEALARAYEEETGTPVQLEYGGSQVILARAASGAAGDLFLPADDDYVRMAEERGLVAETFPLARLRPVLAVAAGNPKRIGSLADLTRDGVRVALANPDTAAVGRLVRDRLGRAGAWERLGARAVVFKPTVGEVANDLRLGTADAARHGRIEGEHLGPDGELVGSAGRSHIDGRGIDDQRAGRCGLEHAPAPYGERILAGRQHRHDGIDAACGICRGRGLFHALRRDFLQVGRHEVEALHLVPLLDEVAGHGHAHVAEPDEAYPCHAFLLANSPPQRPPS